MSPDDFTIESLAEYLHLDPAQVARLADRGKIPGRKVSGNWHFARAEVNGWLEQKIGLSSEEELVQVENMLARTPGAEVEPPISISTMLPLDAVALPLAAKTRGSVITTMCELAGRTGWLWDPERMAEAVRAREDMHSTALDNGVALLHPRRPLPSLLSQAFLALGIGSHGIPFGGPRGALTDIFFLVCSLDDRGHLRVLARLSRLLNHPGLVADLRRASDAWSARKLIFDLERELVE